MKKLYIIRHGKAEANGPTDKLRKLAPKGILQSRFLNQYLLETGAMFNILYSNATRTSETKAHVSNNLNQCHECGMTTLYGADFMKLFKVVESQTLEEDIILIAHNPGVSRLVEYLCDVRFHARTGTLIELEFNIEHWREVSPQLCLSHKEIRFSEQS